MRGLDFELDHLLNPAAVFSHPRDVLTDPDLSRHEKRAILYSWASDACALESARQLRHPVEVDEHGVQPGDLEIDLPDPGRRSGRGDDGRRPPAGGVA